jgi:hypothetical protein
MSSFNVKPGVDWSVIKADFDAGNSIRECVRLQCARGVKITKRAIEKRRDKEGWDTKSAAYKAATRLPSVIAQATGLATTRHRSAEQAKSVIDSLSKGLPYRTAARLAGMSEDTLAKWRDDDPAFTEQCEGAIESWHAQMIGHVDAAAPRDWKAAQWRLQSHNKTKSEYAEKNSGTIIQVNLNIGRENDAPTVTIDAKPV